MQRSTQVGRTWEAAWPASSVTPVLFSTTVATSVPSNHNSVSTAGGQNRVRSQTNNQQYYNHTGMI